MHRWLLMATLALWAVPGTVRAGYIFFKNGYIMQGRVTDKSDEQVVLNYPSGEVVIANRYVKYVLLDPAEEEFLAAKKRTVEASDREVIDDSKLELNVHLPELPESLSDIIEIDKIEKPTKDDGAVAAGVVEKPAEFAQLALRVHLPTGWTATLEDGVLCVDTGVKDGPNLKIQRVQRFGLSAEERTEEMAAVFEKYFPEAEIIGQESMRVGEDTAVGIAGVMPEKKLTFKQFIIERDEHLYLIGMQWTGPANADVQEQLQRFAGKLEWL